MVVTTHTNPEGDFIFPDVQPGTYTVVVSAPGYKEVRKVDNVLYALQNLATGDYTLPVGAVSQTVTIEADITALQTESSERSGVLDTQQTDNLLAVGRDVMSMTKIIPGVVENSYGMASMGQATAPVVNGVNNEYSMSTVDGAISNTRGLSNMDTPINLDAVKEVSVNESNYTAQYGGEAGRRVQLRHQERHQQVPRRPLRILPQRGSERQHLLRQVWVDAVDLYRPSPLSVQHGGRHRRRPNLLAAPFQQRQETSFSSSFPSRIRPSLSPTA